MTIDQIDKALAEWQSNLAAASANLLEFDDLLAFKRLRGDQGLPPPRLTGLSAKRVKPALDAIPLLWRYLQLLTDVVNTATDLRKTVRIWNADSTIKQIDSLLKSPSITLSSEETPLAQRTLLSDANRAERTTPRRLLALMTETFDMAKTAILDVDAAWQRMEPALASCNNEIKSLRNIAITLGEEEIPELLDAEQRIHALRSAIQNDPLGVDADFQTEVTPHLQRVRDRLNDLKQQREQVQAELARAQKILSELIEDNRLGRQALDECHKKIKIEGGLLEPVPEAAIEDMKRWFETLQATLQQGRWRPARVGLQRWLQIAEAHSQTATAALNANRTPLELYAELRGRLSSLRAKALAFQKRGITVDPSIERLAEETDSLLTQNPVPINEAARYVSDYEAKLNRALHS